MVRSYHPCYCRVSEETAGCGDGSAQSCPTIVSSPHPTASAGLGMANKPPLRDTEDIATWMSETPDGLGVDRVHRAGNSLDIDSPVLGRSAYPTGLDPARMPAIRAAWRHAPRWVVSMVWTTKGLPGVKASASAIIRFCMASGMARSWEKRM